MNGVDFSKIATKYEDYSSVQKSAAEILLNILKIGNTDDVLDLGCGVGSLTRKIKEITNGKVVNPLHQPFTKDHHITLQSIKTPFFTTAT